MNASSTIKNTSMDVGELSTSKLGSFDAIFTLKNRLGLWDDVGTFLSLNNVLLVNRNG